MVGEYWKGVEGKSSEERWGKKKIGNKNLNAIRHRYCSGYDRNRDTSKHG
jgi:hypothetical protein